MLHRELAKVHCAAAQADKIAPLFHPHHLRTRHSEDAYDVAGLTPQVRIGEFAANLGRRQNLGRIEIDVVVLNLDAADAYQWTLYHLIQNENVIKETMFPITYFRAHGSQWAEEGRARPRYWDIGVTNYTGDLNDRTLSLIADVPATGEAHGSRRLRDMAVVIRSKDAGINRLTFDIVFNSAADYESALTSNVFAKRNVAALLGVSVERIVGSYFVDSCNAIKISMERPNISASLDEHDVFGAQQQAVVEQLTIPVYAERLARASSF